MRLRSLLLLLAGVGVSTFSGHAASQAPAVSAPALADRARALVAQYDGTIVLAGLSEQVEVLRDRWGTPHIYARNTADLFFAQGFVAAQDRMWQLEMWRRNGEGRLAEVLGPEYVTRDRFARLLAFRGNWDEELRRYHREGPVIFESFARGVNAAIHQALAEERVPIEFDVAGFRPQPVWTAQTVANRMPGWSLTRNVASEVQRALDIKTMGLQKTQELRPTDPARTLTVPDGLDLDDIDADILAVARNANNLQYPVSADFGSNNWVVGGPKSTTGMPLLANDPHREVVNPSLRYLVHLNAPGWNAIGATEPAAPGISIGHNDRIAWGFTILGIDQQDLYVEDTKPDAQTSYLVDGVWQPMQVRRELIYVKGRTDPIEVELKYTRHGPVLHENAVRHRAFALRWAGAEPGGAGYLGSINVMQARNWAELNAAFAKSWFTPSHSIVYADVDGHYGYAGVGLTPVRKNWDGLLPVPGEDSRYEWQGFVPFDRLPKSLDAPAGFYNTSNNDVVPKIVPHYRLPLGYEYGSSYRYDRIKEVLGAKRTLGMSDMQALQQDALSIPARRLVPLLRAVVTSEADVRWAIDTLLRWNFVLDRESVAATIYEFWINQLAPMAYGPRVPEAAKARFGPAGRAAPYDIDEVIRWMERPDAAYGADAAARGATRDRILIEAMRLGLADLTKRVGPDRSQWKWGDVHTADLIHPLGLSDKTRELFRITPIRRGGDGFTPMAATSVSNTNVKQQSGASIMFVLDVQDWDRSTALNTPGNSGQPGSPHYADLAPLWGNGEYFPLAFSRKKVDEVTGHRLVLHPTTRAPSPEARDAAGDVPRFAPVQPALFSVPGAVRRRRPRARHGRSRPDARAGRRRAEPGRLRQRRRLRPLRRQLRTQRLVAQRRWRALHQRRARARRHRRLPCDHVGLGRHRQ
jgi:penicillin amidase